MNLRVLKQRFASAANDARNAHTAHIAAAAVVVACRRRSSKGIALLITEAQPLNTQPNIGCSLWNLCGSPMQHIAKGQDCIHFNFLLRHFGYDIE
jgi:hypothetical protein